MPSLKIHVSFASWKSNELDKPIYSENVTKQSQIASYSIIEKKWCIPTKPVVKLLLFTSAVWHTKEIPWNICEELLIIHFVKLHVLVIVNIYLKMLLKCLSQKIREFFHEYFPGILFLLTLSNFLNNSQLGCS